MTGYTVHTGTSKQFVSGWDRVFGSKSKKKSTAASSATSGAKKSQRRKKK